MNFKLNKSYLVGLILGTTALPSFASVVYQCNGGQDDTVCQISYGNTKDKYPSEAITQSVIDEILQKNKKAKSLTIEFTSGKYQVYPLNFKKVDNLTLLWDAGAQLYAIPYSKKKSNGWDGADQLISFVQCNNLALKGAAPSANQLDNNKPKPDTTMPSIIDGQGQDWWEATKKEKINRPYLMLFSKINNLTITDLQISNSPDFHLKIQDTSNLKIDQILIHSEQKSPNTDGINMSSVKGVTITNSTIYNGDDGIAFNSGNNSPCSNVNISNIDMYYGHGISFGSTINSNMENMDIEHIRFFNTANGIRIKAHDGRKNDDHKHEKNKKSDFAMSSDDSDANLGDFDPELGKSSAATVHNIKYNDIQMENVDNPIIFDLSYDNSDWAKIQINNIAFSNIATTNSKHSVSLICGSTNNCNNITANDIKLDKKAECRDIQLNYNGKSEKYKDKTGTCLTK